jgi:hypothetical protein
MNGSKYGGFILTFELGHSETIDARLRFQSREATFALSSKDWKLLPRELIALSLYPEDPGIDLAACPMLTDACTRALSALWEAAFDLRSARVRAHPGAGSIARARLDRARCGNARSAMRGSCVSLAECGERSRGKSSSASSPVATRARASRGFTATPAGTSTCSPTRAN